MPNDTHENTFSYDVLSVISENEKTKVCLAASPVSEEPIVVKMLKNGDTQLVRKIAEISSPHLPKILHVEDGIVFEEYISGMPLDEYITSQSLAEPEIVELILQICEGLRELHSQEPPIIHRDLKPSNILVQTQDGEPVVKIIDFDASREYKTDQSHDTRALGTDTYAPPEQFGYSQTDVRSDIYSLGSVLDEVTRDIEVSEGLREVIAKATMFNPDQRYADIDEFADALQGYGDRRIIKLPIILAAMALCVAAVCLLWLWKPWHKKNSEDIPAQTLDTVNPETGASVKWVFYYLTKSPELSPLALRTMNTHGPAKDIRIGTDSDPYGKEISDSEWHEDEDGFIHIDDAFLSTLDKNITYTVTVDFTDVRLVFDLMCIEDAKAATLGVPVLNPGYSEFVRSDPKDITIHLANTFGRRLKSLTNMDDGKELGSSDYSYDEENQSLVLYRSYFEKFHDGDYVNIEYAFEETDKSLLPAPKDLKNPTAITICVREKPYIVPVVKKKGVAMSEGEDEDIFVDIEFNSAEGKLEEVFLEDKNTPDATPATLKPTDYEVQEDGILVKGSYLKTLTKGEYNLIFEFGDVARRVQLTVA